MTEEQIKNLKVGDKIAITLTAKETNDHMAFVDESGSPFILATSNIHRATLVTPPPSFEVGDTVRIIRDPMTGTIYGFATEFKPSAEGKEGNVVLYVANRAECHVAIGECKYDINVHCLELVKKAVKDKFYVDEQETCYQVKELGEDVIFGVALYYKDSHPNARAAAEAECARLNKRWRKQQEGGAE